MSEHLFKIFLDELRTLRLVCSRANCGAAIELSIDQLATLSNCKCPVCDTSFLTPQPGTGVDPLFAFANGLRVIAAVKDRYKVQFVLPSDADSGGKKA